MAQKTSWNGAALTESDINTYLSGEGGAWTTWTPTLTQSGTVTATVTSAVYGRWGRLIVGQFRLSVTGTGTGSNAVTVSLPVTSAREDALPRLLLLVCHVGVKARRSAVVLLHLPGWVGSGPTRPKASKSTFGEAKGR